METINELLMSLFVLIIAAIFLTEQFYHIIKNKIHKKQQHYGHTPKTAPGVDKEGEGKKGVYSHSGNGASYLLAFLLITILLSVLSVKT